MPEPQLPKLPSTFSGFFLALHVFVFLIALIALLYGSSSYADLCRKLIYISVVGIIIGAIYHYVVDRHFESEANQEERIGFPEFVAKEFFRKYYSCWVPGILIYVVVAIIIVVLV